MKHGGKMLACMMSGLTVCTVARAVPTDTADNPYQSIIDRNVFSLKPPPPPPDPAEANKPQALKITLTGITTILGNKRVLMKTAPPPGKPGEAPKTEQSYILTEGQREGEIEVIQIDEKAGSVKVNNAGSVQTLTFEKDGAKLPSTPAPAAAGVPGLPGAAPLIPGLPVNRAIPQPPGTTPSFQLPTRIPRVPPPGAQASAASPGSSFTPAASTPGYAPGFLPGNTTAPGFQTSGSVPGNTQTILPGSQMTLEEQVIRIEAERQAGGATAALLPPTPLSPNANVQGAGNQTPTQTPQSPGITFPPIPGRPPGPY